MSKSKQKDKKNQVNFIDIAIFDAQKKDLISATFTIKKLQQRLAMITKENMILIEQSRQNKKIYQDQIEKLTAINQNHQQRNLILSGQKTKFQIQNQQKKTKINLLQKQLTDEQHLRSIELSQYKKNVSFQINKYQSQLLQYKQYMNQRDQLQAQRANLRQQIQMEKADKIRQVADKQRQKVQATDKLRDEMLKKIREMRTNLLSLKKEQLQTTTRLTILQNHQLTSQLQYQSKQTEKLIFKNEQMQTKINVLERDLDIHKQVEEQLAKRSHLSKGMIKKLNIRIAELEQQVSQLRKQVLTSNSNLNTNINTNNNNSNANNKTHFGNNNTFTNNQQNLSQINSKNEILLQALNKNLQSTQKKYVQLSTRYQLLMKEKQQMFYKLQKYQGTSNKLGSVLLKYFTYISEKGKIPQQIQTQKSNQNNNNPYLIPTSSIESQKHLQINIHHLKQSDVQNWKSSDIQTVVKILLTCIKPLITKNNLPIPSIRKNLYLVNQIDDLKQRQHFRQRQTTSSKKLLQSLSSRNLGQSLNIKLSKGKQNQNHNLHVNNQQYNELMNTSHHTNNKINNKRDVLSQDRYKQIIKDKLHQLPTNVASKIVTSNLREWGKTVLSSNGRNSNGCNNNMNFENFTGNKLRRKYKLNDSYR